MASASCLAFRSAAALASASEYLDTAPQGFGSTTQLTITPHNNGLPFAFPKPSASWPSEINLLEVARPRTLPVESKIGPPEFPGFIGAVKVKVLAAKSIEEIIPVVRIPACPKGEPKTPTHQPCFGTVPIHSAVGNNFFVAIPAISFD